MQARECVCEHAQVTEGVRRRPSARVTGLIRTLGTQLQLSARAPRLLTPGPDYQPLFLFLFSDFFFFEIVPLWNTG